MKRFDIYFTDAPNDPLKVSCNSKTQAQRIGKQYIKLWQLEAKIERIEEE